MALLRNVLNGGVAEVGDEFAPALIESGHWVDASEAPVKKTRARAKAAPADSGE